MSALNLSAREAAALHRLLDAYTAGAGDEGDPGLEDLRAVHRKVGRRRRTTSPTNPRSPVPMPETWYAHPNDLIGGWSVMNRDHPPSGLNRHVDPDGREVATFMSDADARRIVELHNADRRPILIYNSYGAEDRWPAREGWRLDPNSVADTREQVERYIAMYPEIEHRLIWREIREWSDGSSWTGPWVAVDPEEKP